MKRLVITGSREMKRLIVAGAMLALLVSGCGPDLDQQVQERHDQILTARSYCMSHVTSDSDKTMCDYDAQQELNRLQAQAAEARQGERAAWANAAAQWQQAGQSFQWMGH
jgi:hypothetical protein